MRMIPNNTPVSICLLSSFFFSERAFARYYKLLSSTCHLILPINNSFIYFDLMIYNFCGIASRMFGILGFFSGVSWLRVDFYHLLFVWFIFRNKIHFWHKNLWIEIRFKFYISREILMKNIFDVIRFKYIRFLDD